MMMLTLKKAMELTGLPYHTLREMCLNGKVHCIKSGTKYYMYRDSLLSYLTGKDIEEHENHGEGVESK